MTVQITLFGSIREQLGKDVVAVPISGQATALAALESLRTLHPGAKNYFNPDGKPLVNIARGEEMLELDSTIADGDHLEIIAPIAGGEQK